MLDKSWQIAEAVPEWVRSEVQLLGVALVLWLAARTAAAHIWVGPGNCNGFFIVCAQHRSHLPAATTPASSPVKPLSPVKAASPKVCIVAAGPGVTAQHDDESVTFKDPEVVREFTAVQSAVGPICAVLDIHACLAAVAAGSAGQDRPGPLALALQVARAAQVACCQAHAEARREPGPRGEPACLPPPPMTRAEGGRWRGQAPRVRASAACRAASARAPRHPSGDACLASIAHKRGTPLCHAAGAAADPRGRQRPHPHPAQVRACGVI